MTDPAKKNPVRIEILKDGPIRIKGDFLFRNSSGEVSSEHKDIYICRCGGSGNKPFCDGTHKKAMLKN